MSSSAFNNAVWITWESQPRNRSMARSLGVMLHEFNFEGSRIRRQLKCLAATVGLLLRQRPKVVFASNPSLVLTYVLLASRVVLGFRFVSDAHYGGIIAVKGGKNVQRLLDFANRRADVVIVTNTGHADRVRSIGGTPFICPDPLPVLPETSSRPAGLTGVGKSVLFICSYEVDEPFTEVFEAARLLAKQDIRVFASGSYARAGLSPDRVPDVTLLGYVDRATYHAYLQNVDVVLDLTTWQDCLVCGAYEAMAAGKPCVLSGTRALTELFTGGTVFSAHGPADIAQAILSAFEGRNALKSQIAQWVVGHEEATRKRAAALRASVGLPALA